jgi:diguanylate cyclase (GGDEF)-like protein
MIWDSIVLMAMFDVFIVSIVCYTSYVFYQKRQAIQHFHATIPVILMLCGLGIIALFYVADLITMFVLPLYMPMMQAMEVMKTLHLNYLWLVMVAGVSLLVIGVLQLFYRVFPTHISTMEVLKDTHQQLTHLASTDPLTGLSNRRTFLDEVKQLVEHPEHSGYKSAILFLDLDGFKPINDTEGHDVGDAVLHTVAKRIEKTIRRSDIAARYGGDEFTVCLRGIDHGDGIERIARQLAASVSTPIQIDDMSFSISASIGISIYPDHGNDVLTLLEKADSAMYEVKRSGGNGVAFHGHGITGSRSSRSELEV